jgi:excinuclease ABC subunit A
MGNSVLVVEHDEDAIRAADYVIDMGPGAGVHGGEVVAEGTPARSPQANPLADRRIPVRPAPHFAARKTSTVPDPDKLVRVTGATATT